MPDLREPTFVDLIWLLEMSHEQYIERFRGTAVRRAKHWMLQRNAAVALGNVGNASTLPALERSMVTNPHPVVRAHAAWAIGRIGLRLNLPQAGVLLRDALSLEQDDAVRGEINESLGELE